MLGRLVASWLVVLVALPFTEPFLVLSAPLAASRHVTKSVVVATVPSLAKTRQLRLWAAARLRDGVTTVQPGAGPGRFDTSAPLVLDRSVLALVLRL